MSIFQTPPPLLPATAVTPPPPPGRRPIFPMPCGRIDTLRPGRESWGGGGGYTVLLAPPPAGAIGLRRTPCGPEGGASGLPLVNSGTSTGRGWTVGPPPTRAHGHTAEVDRGQGRVCLQGFAERLAALVADAVACKGAVSFGGEGGGRRGRALVGGGSLVKRLPREWVHQLYADRARLVRGIRVEEQKGGLGQGCIRRGGGGGEGGLAGTPSSQGHPVVLAEGRPRRSLNPLGTEGAEAKFWLSASNIGRAGGVGRGPGGGGTPSSCGIRPFVLLSAASGAYRPLATYRCPSLEPSPSAGGGAPRPLTPLCPPTPCRWGLCKARGPSKGARGCLSETKPAFGDGNPLSDSPPLVGGWNAPPAPAQMNVWYGLWHRGGKSARGLFRWG